MTERRRQETRLEIAETAAALFSDQGYEATTVEDIASGAGISLRTFYRYCAAKEDALTPVMTSSVGVLVEELARRPVDEPLSSAVQASFTSSAAARQLADREQARRLVRVMGTVPAIRMRWLAAGREMQDQLVPVLAARKGASEDSMEVRLLACALLDAISVAMEHWAWQDEPEDVAELTRRAVHYLRIDEL
ncbi:TetR family transcriptional regulator [Streptomyces sp. RPA4-5]|uniref:TetR/AcrR family transcriptional regulator n=1 Tax=Streptomyces TaxID=1883 RepID=UPI00143EC303|nr:MULTISPECIES: TetR/AcrR family transcriptional regulator [Streptomyces]MCX4635348.1 TetR/AcrR family transcriptional regulator [Streptomyces platensis]QIY58515.1 TetR family transcriptional regulator [Streptomyces sp. RPA4-5]WJY41754.1 TetR family transcriptional regulator [Streptomyces sp. P9-2B-2]